MVTVNQKSNELHSGAVAAIKNKTKIDWVAERFSASVVRVLQIYIKKCN